MGGGGGWEERGGGWKGGKGWLMMDQYLIRKEQQHILEIIKPVQYANLPQLLT